MKVKSIEIFKNIECTECHGKDNAKELYLGSNKIALCEGCREELHAMLYKEYLESIKCEE